MFCSGDTTQCAKNIPASQTSLATKRPLNPTSPVVVLSSAPSVGICSNLTLDATASYGNGGRPYASILWNVFTASNSTAPARSDAAKVAALLNTHSLNYKGQISTPISILAQYLNPTSYTITLTLKNFLGLTSSAAVIVKVKTDKNLPLLSIIGPSYRTIVASSPLTILSVATLSSCASSAPASFAWTVKEGNRTAITDIKSVSLDPSIFAIPSYRLVVNNNYTITITASTNTSKVSASAIVYVAHGVVTAVIVGGTYRSAPVDRVLQLDASGSYDSDYPQTSVSMLSYQVQQYQYYRGDDDNHQHHTFRYSVATPHLH